jgi:hypothetical protein
MQIIRVAAKLVLTLRFHRVLSARARAIATVTARLITGQHRRSEKETIPKPKL